MPLLNVLLPARNAEQSVGQAVASTLRALPRDAHLTVLDDGSTDATAECAEAAGRGDTRITVHSVSTPGGIAGALNWLIAHTDSHLVARMDADDVCLPWRFRAALPAARRSEFTFCQVINEQVGAARWAKLRPAAPAPIPPSVFPLHLLLTNPASHPAMIAHRSALAELGGYREVPAEDYDLWMRAALYGHNLHRLAHWGLIYRLHPGQITADPQWRQRSWRNPEQATVFGDLSEKLTGARLERLVSIALDPPDERTHKLALMQHHLSAAIARTPHPHRAFLERKLQQRLAWARTFSTTL